MQYSILIVDDEHIIRQSIEAIFSEDYDIYKACSGEEAVEIIQKNHIDLVLLDMRMVGSIDGIATLKLIKQQDASIEVIMATAVKDKYILDEAMKHGACDYIEKPFDIDDLINRVYRILFEKMKQY
ncbi:MAG TPA: two-component system response regulator [Candidatus Margulisbacteria bacterium]|nr:MAG: hypothetical protein A2X43_01175 [Candidatus Margulisbacteria bacterium GWD2_39_127]OGI03332.1 MAG: hypothetical protein A2X42_06960 [Candidatus Margulisbacteria bacterium GWF2_38_17]OGI12016.1 MAG: hypothetical protein A2X41_03040 [Candidatus Margulisbacteria bacterium GWE2_39_32]HAR63170.1 two-component system response regulator [Candidatus Margulisiibacteriota bacterium]HCT84990.1 two-component system response regulator [Candidatus Margulisiibacteriota bacterium]